jgi:SAM-dependent methyltransferase
MATTTYDIIRDAYDLVFADTYKKVPFVCELLKKYKVSSALELGSGSGLFTIPIKEAGFAIEGLELSQEMITFMAQKQGDLPLHQGNIRNYRLNKQYDAILMLSSILVLLNSHEEIEESLQASHEHLPANGLFLLELPNHPVEIRESGNTQEVHTSDDDSTIVVIQSHATEQFWREHWYIFRQEGKVFSRETTICDELLYSPETLVSQLDKTGFDVVETYGDLFGQPFDEETSWRRVLVCQKR